MDEDDDLIFIPVDEDDDDFNTEDYPAGTIFG